MLKVKVKVSLCLTKYHALKMCPVPRHEGVQESGGIAPHILNLGTRYK